MNLYHIARKVIKLPRPNEIWEGGENRWTFERAYQYADTCFAEGMSHAQKPFGIVNTIVGFLILFELKDVASTSTVIFFGVLLFFSPLILGHILFVVGFIKRRAKLATSQAPDIVEIRDNVRKIMEKL